MRVIEKPSEIVTAKAHIIEQKPAEIVTTTAASLSGSQRKSSPSIATMCRSASSVGPRAKSVGLEEWQRIHGYIE